MKHRLYLRSILSYLLYGAVAFAVIFLFTQKLTYNHVIAEEAQDINRECSYIASDYGKAYYGYTLSLDEFQKHMEATSKYMNAKIWIVDPEGRLLIDSSNSQISADASEQIFTEIPNFDIRDFGNSFYRISDFYGQFNYEVLTVYSPITINYDVKAYVVIHKAVSKINSTTDSYTNITFYTVGIMYFLGFFIFLIYTASINRPIRKIDKIAKAYAKGDFSKKININSNDEIGYLANTLDYMANELETLEEDQRKFVSNVSHDFRSPLTSIKGYVEAMQDGTIPYEMQDKYLNIILFETERLNKLTKSLIDLNQFGRHGIRLDVADFDINQMIRTTVLVFEGTCQKKGISFDLVLTGKELFVAGDMSKIQQVIYNLIDNAIKFSHHNSKIKIESQIKNEKVLISVKDTGIGIPSDSLSKIWDRFYKIDSSRGKDKKGTGLGLAIVKEIIQAHNEHINVVSTEGVGTEFLFTLPLSIKEQ